MGDFQFWMFLAGLGIFLFGIYMLEESIEKLSGKAFKRLIRSYTSNRFRAIGSGVLATGILQSSSAVSLMALAFVSAGVIGMSQAVGVIIGSSLGTTITSWLVATIGFKVKIESIALPFVGLGGLGLIFFGKNTRFTHISRLIVGFGFLFMGLDYMKTSVDELAVQFDPSMLSGYGSWAFVLAALVLTAIIQSSSATVAIVLSALYGELLTFHQAAAMVIGANVGTTVTVLLGSIGGNILKKRVALSHLFYKTITAFFAWILLPVLVYISLDVFHFKSEPVLGLAMFHTLFNVMGIILFVPFIEPYTRMIEKITHVKPGNIEKHIQKLDAEVPEGAVGSLRLEIHRLMRIIMHYNLAVWRVDANLISALTDEDEALLQVSQSGSREQFSHIQTLYEQLLQYSVRVHNLSMEKTEADQLNHLLQALRLTMNAMLAMQEAREVVGELEESSTRRIQEYFHNYRQHLFDFYRILMKKNEGNMDALAIGSDYQKLKENIKLQDEAISRTTMEDIHQQRIEQRHLLRIMSAQRSYYQSCRQIMTASREWQLAGLEKE